MTLATVILAAGKGTRMKSVRPKVLHPVAGLSMLGHVIKAAERLSPAHLLVVTGHQAADVEEAVAELSPGAVCALQEPQLGTGHAVMQARETLRGFAGDVLVLYGDGPLIQPATLMAMREKRRTEGAAIVVLGFEAEDPTGYGRLILDNAGRFNRIVEHKDASDEERAVTLCNSGIMCIDGALLFDLLDGLSTENASGEYYLTDIVGLACGSGLPCVTITCPEVEVMGGNDRVQLAALEAAFQARRREEAMREGATLIAPETVFFAHDTELGRDVTIAPHVVFGPGVVVEDNTEIRAFTHLEGCRIRKGAGVGPFARIRPGTDIGEGSHVGNFVEIKNVQFAPGVKAGHLSYLGDAEIGSGTNIGAGTITCNYDGVMKHRTCIGEKVFIGSNASLVAPLSIGDEAMTAAGSTITEDVPAKALALGRAKQVNKPGLASRLMAHLRQIKAGQGKTGKEK